VPPVKQRAKNMKKIKSISDDANQLREKFQKLIVNEFIKTNGSLKGYRCQIYILLPKFDKRLPLYKGIAKETYHELYNYLSQIQSQRRFIKQDYVENYVSIVKTFANQNFSICYNRVWHNGTTSRNYKHWAAQAAALLDGVKKYGFTFYEHDYNFSNRSYNDLNNANPLLKSIYAKILERSLTVNICANEN
jgi:hypothetical protein